MRLYPTPKAAIAAVARLHRRAGPARVSQGPTVDQTREGDPEAGAIAVRSVLRELGIDPDDLTEGEDMEILATWATEEGYRSPDDALAELAEDQAECLEHLARSRARESRRRALAGHVAAALVEAGIIPRRLRMKRVGYRAVVDESGPRTQVVTDPHPDDQSVFTGPGARGRALAAARAGVGSTHEVCARPDRKHPDLAAELLPRWRSGEFQALGDLDLEVMARLRCSRRWAQVVRASWGVAGTMGRKPTRPEENTLDSRTSGCTMMGMLPETNDIDALADLHAQLEARDGQAEAGKSKRLRVYWDRQGDPEGWAWETAEKRGGEVLRESGPLDSAEELSKLVEWAA